MATNKHTTTLVPVETWLYHSPRLKLNDINIDMGLVCEALIYYDSVYISIDNKEHFNSIIAWFQLQGAFTSLLALLDNGVINFAFHPFMTSPVYDPKMDVYSIWNLDDDESKREDVFSKRILYNSGLHNIIRTRERSRLFKAISEKNIFELKAINFGDSIDNARTDSENPEKTDIIVQSFIDDLYKEFGFTKPSAVHSSLVKNGDRTTLSWDVNFDEMNRVTNNKLGLHRGLPLSGIAHCNRLIKTSSILESDLYLGSVMNSLVNNKLLEISQRNTKIETVISELKTRVEFPKISMLINNKILRFENIIEIRKESKKFREWLQQEGERDRDAIIAYHTEIATKTGLATLGKGTLSLTGSAIGGALGAILTGPLGGALGAVTGSMADKFISSFNKDWQPVVFGDWTTKYIEKID